MLDEVNYNRLRNVVTTTIDTNMLDDALINMPMDQMEIAEHTAAASAERDRAKFELEQVTAMCASRMRGEDPKISQTRVESELPLFDEITDAEKMYNDAKYTYNLWTGLADACRTKMSAIRVIADLIAAGYMTSNTIRQDRREVIHQYRMAQQKQD